MEQKEKFYVCIHFPHTFLEIKEIEGGKQYVINEICKHLSTYSTHYNICLGSTTSSRQSVFFYGKILKSLGLTDTPQYVRVVHCDSDLGCARKIDGSSLKTNLLIVVDENGKGAKHYLSKAKDLGISTIVIPCKKIEEKLTFKSFVLYENGHKEIVQLIEKYSFSVHYEYEDLYKPIPDIWEAWSTIVDSNEVGIGLFRSNGKIRFHTLHRNGHWFHTDYEELMKHINIYSETELYNIIKRDVLYYVSNPSAPIMDKFYGIT